MKVRLKDIVDSIKYHVRRGVEVKHEGPSRDTRRRLAARSRYRATTKHGAARMRPKNWTRDRHKRRKEEKRRRKQAFLGH